MKSTKLFFSLLTFFFISTTFAQTSLGLSSPTTNTLDVVVQNENGQLSYIAWTGKKWSKWRSLESPANTNLSVQTISVESGRTEIIGVSDKGSVYHAFLKDNKLSDWQVIGLYTNSFPEVVSWGKGRFDVFITNKKGEILHTYFTNGNWSKKWKNHGGNVSDNQSTSVVAQAKGKLDIFYRSKKGELKHKAWNKNTWSDWETVPGMRLSSPVVASSMANGRLDLFTRGSKGEVMNSSKIFGRWSKWVNIGKDISGQKGIHVHKRGENLDIFYINRSGQLLHQTANSKGRSEWSVVGKTNQLPSTTSWSSNRTDISFLNGKGELRQAYFNGKKWSSLRNKGKLKFETMVVIPTTSDVLIAIPSFDKFKLKYPEKYKKSNIQPVDSDNKSLNKNSNQSETTDNGWIASDNGIFCRTFTIEAEDDDRLENKIIGDVPAGIVPGTIMQKDVFINSNYNLVWDAPVKRKSFNITNTSPNYANDVIDTIPSRRSFITYAQINSEIDKKWRKRRRSGEYDFVTGDYQFYRNNNVERLLFELGISANYLSANTKFSLKKKKYRYGETYIGYQENIYFTAIASDDGNGWLEEGQNAENLLLVEKVTYGRQLLIKVEKKIEKESISYSAQFDANFIGNYNAKVESEKATENSEYTITTYAVGGHELEGFIPIGVYTGRYANLREALTAVDAKRQFSSSNRGYPISYELKDLHSNTPQKFRYSTPEIVEKPLCIPLSTDYIIRIKKARIQEESPFGDTGRKLEIWGDINVTLDGRNIGNLITGSKQLGSNPYAKNPNAKKQIKVPGTIPISLDNSVWEYSPGFIADGNRKNDLPRFRLTRSTLDRDYELNFDAELKEIDPQRRNRNENFAKVTATVNLRKLLALNPNLHDFGGEETLVFDLTDNRILEFVVEFIPIDSSAERLPIIAFDEEDTGDTSSENDIGIIEENGINTSADISSSLQYVITDDGVCLCHIEKSDILDYEFNINNSSSSIAPGTIFKLSNFIKENNPFLDQTLPDGIRRGPIDLTIENLTSVGRQDSISGFFIPAFKKGNTQSIAISNEITKALVNNRNDIYATANSNVNVITTKNARQAAFAAGLSVNTAFVDADIDFFKSTSSSNETIFAIIKRNFFKVSARPTAISPFKGNYTWAFSGDYDVEQEEVDYGDTGTISSTQNNSDDFQVDILRRLQLNPIVNRQSADDVLQTEGYAYVGEVTYGELAIIKFETSYSESETDLKARIESQFMGIGGSVNTEYNLFRSDSTTNVEAMYYGFNSEIARHITNEEEVKELFNDLTSENNMFNPADPFIGRPLSFKAFQVGSNKIIGNFAVDQNITSNYFCSEKNMRIELKLTNFKPFGDWNDRGRRGIEIIGEIIPFFILDKGRVIANEDNKLLFTDGSRIKLESNLSQNSEPTSIPSSAAPEIDLLFDNTIVSAGLTYKDIINGKMYLQFNLSEHDSGDENEKFLYVSEEIPIYELIPEKGTNKEIKIKAKYKHKSDTYLEFTLKVERP